jgi:hypothetical protein
MDTMTQFRPGTVAWRIHHPPAGKQLSAVKCVVMRVHPNGHVAVRASTFAAQEKIVAEGDIFADREACRAEILRRAGL